TSRSSGTATKRTSAAPCCPSARPATACTRARGPALGYARRMNRLLLLSLSLAGIVAVLSPPAAIAQGHADTILVGGKVWTGNPEQPEAQALAIADGKVAAVGSDAEVRRWAGPSTSVIALQGRRVVPGFN